MHGGTSHSQGSETRMRSYEFAYRMQMEVRVIDLKGETENKRVLRSKPKETAEFGNNA